MEKMTRDEILSTKRKNQQAYQTETSVADMLQKLREKALRDDDTDWENWEEDKGKKYKIKYKSKQRRLSRRRRRVRSTRK